MTLTSGTNKDFNLTLVSGDPSVDPVVELSVEGIVDALLTTAPNGDITVTLTGLIVGSVTLIVRCNASGQELGMLKVTVR